MAVRSDFDNLGKVVRYPVWSARRFGGALKAPPAGPGPEKKGISTILKFNMLLRLLGQQFHYYVHCKIGWNSRVVKNNGLVLMPFPLIELNISLQAAAY